ncbi:MAG: hypothetical protein LBV69_07345 [Bacteroidales bacterium]|jgi:hypothetical protein|nr:hypothetical protein [Bacteroidales bacterium]
MAENKCCEKKCKCWKIGITVIATAIAGVIAAISFIIIVWYFNEIHGIQKYDGLYDKNFCYYILVFTIIIVLILIASILHECCLKYILHKEQKWNNLDCAYQKDNDNN